MVHCAHCERREYLRVGRPVFLELLQAFPFVEVAIVLNGGTDEELDAKCRYSPLHHAISQ